MHASREIAIYGDAVALNSRERLGPSRLLRILARELWKSYVRPTDPYQRFFWYAEEGAEPVPIVPVFRYRVLLPADALEKHRRHVSMYGELEEYRRLHEDVAGAYARYEASGDVEDFWRFTAESFCGLRRCGRALPRRLPPEEHPGIIATS